MFPQFSFKIFNSFLSSMRKCIFPQCCCKAFLVQVSTFFLSLLNQHSTITFSLLKSISLINHVTYGALYFLCSFISFLPNMNLETLNLSKFSSKFHFQGDSYSFFLLSPYHVNNYSFQHLLGLYYYYYFIISHIVQRLNRYQLQIASG